MPTKKNNRLLNKNQNYKSNKRINVRKNKQAKKTKKHHPKKTRQNILLRPLTHFSRKRSQAGEARNDRPRTRSEIKAYNYEKKHAPECVELVYNLLGNIAAGREKVDYLLTQIKAATDPTHIDEWNAILEMGASYRQPNTQFLKKILMDPLQDGSIIHLANEAAAKVKEKMVENVAKAENPDNYAAIKLDISQKILEVLHDPNYVYKNEDENNFNSWLSPHAVNIVGALFDVPIAPEKYDKTYSIKPIRAIYSINGRDRHVIAYMLTKALLFVDSNNIGIAGILKKSKYGFPQCNARLIPILEKLQSVYEEIFTELIRYAPASLFREFEGVPDVDDYYHGLGEWRANERNLPHGYSMSDSEVYTDQTS